jgi:hypothetical protein
MFMGISPASVRSRLRRLASAIIEQDYMKMNIFWKSRFWAMDRHVPSPPPISAERARRPVLRRDVGRITTADLAEARGSAANLRVAPPVRSPPSLTWRTTPAFQDDRRPSGAVLPLTDERGSD